MSEADVAVGASEGERECVDAGIAVRSPSLHTLDTCVQIMRRQSVVKDGRHHGAQGNIVRHPSIPDNMLSRIDGNSSEDALNFLKGHARWRRCSRRVHRALRKWNECVSEVHPTFGTLYGRRGGRRVLRALRKWYELVSEVHPTFGTLYGATRQSSSALHTQKMEWFC